MMPRNRRAVLWLSAAAVAIVAGCAESGAPEPFPAATAEALAARIAAHDAAGAASFYTEDAVLLPPDMGAISGRAAVQEFFARTHTEGSPGVELATVETFMLGDHAWRYGSFRFDGPGADEPAAGKFVELWKKVDGHWRIHREMWNANEPLPAAAATEAATDEPA